MWLQRLWHKGLCSFHLVCGNPHSCSPQPPHKRSLETPRVSLAFQHSRKTRTRALQASPSTSEIPLGQFHQHPMEQKSHPAEPCSNSYPTTLWDMEKCVLFQATQSWGGLFCINRYKYPSFFLVIKKHIIHPYRYKAPGGFYKRIVYYVV